MKQTSVELLIQQIEKDFYIQVPIQTIRKYKEMEKQQIIDAYTDGESAQGYEDEAYQYYNETFKK